jgi:ribonuclease R
LRDLADDGLVQKDRKQLVRPDKLPPVTLIDITTRDAEGGLIGRPAEWDDAQKVAPAVSIRLNKAVGRSGKPSRTPGVGDRVLAKIFPSKDRTGRAYTARVIKLIDERKDASLGVFRAEPGGGGRIMPIAE